MKNLKEKNVTFDIDWHELDKLEIKLNYKLLTIFILPPSKKELLKRLIKREKKNMKTVKNRMKEFKKDLSRWIEYDYVVINDDLKKYYNININIINNKKRISYDRNYINKHVKKLLN